MGLLLYVVGGSNSTLLRQPHSVQANPITLDLTHRVHYRSGECPHRNSSKLEIWSKKCVSLRGVVHWDPPPDRQDRTGCRLHYETGDAWVSDESRKPASGADKRVEAAAAAELCWSSSAAASR